MSGSGTSPGGPAGDRWKRLRNLRQVSERQEDAVAPDYDAAWVADAGFAIEEEAEGPWHEEGYAYHHVLARAAAPG
jgi:hypothetical protein